MNLAIGQFDAPQIQKQPIFRLDPYRSNIAVFGTPMSGKTTFIKTLLVRIHENMDQVPGENIYLIDFGGNIGSYGKLRNVCACFDNSNEENIKRVFRTIEKRLAENTKQLDSKNYYSVVTKTPEKAPTHIFLIIENINAFLADERYASYQDKLIRLCRDGLTKGLTVVITANETAGINRLLSNFGQKIAFEMPNDSYYDIFGTKVNKPMKIPGRGVVNIDTACYDFPIDAACYEFQCFLPFPTKDDEDNLAKLISQTAQYKNEHIMAAFTEDLTWDNYASYCAEDAHELPSDNHVVVGLDYYEHKPVTVNIAESRTIAIYGKRKFGKTNLLHLLLNGIKKSRPDAKYIYFDDGRKQLLPFFMPGNSQISNCAEYFTDVEMLKDYLADSGYISIRKNPTAQLSVIQETPFTVFVMQSRMLFRGTGWGPSLLKSLVTSDAKRQDFILIFSDVPNISEHDSQRIFNDNVEIAFLLDSIGDFLADKSDKTPFGAMDARELKAEYAKCSIGDGYVYDVEADELQKLKFIKAN